jgi:hypothetical protein
MIYFDTGASAVKYCNGTSWTNIVPAGGSYQYQLVYYASTGTGISNDTNLTTDATNDLLVSVGKIAIGTSNVANAVTLTGQAAKTISMVRETTASTAGNNLTLQAGGANSGGTDLSGGNLILSSGIATGNNTSSTLFSTYPAAAVSGSTDNTKVTMLTLSGTGSATSGQGTLNTKLQTTSGSGTDKKGGTLTLASGVSTGTGASSINFEIYPVGVTGTTANAPITALTITNTGAMNINLAAQGLQLNGNNAITFPTTDSVTGGSVGVGYHALNNQKNSASAAYSNTAVGYNAFGTNTATTAAIHNTGVGFYALANLTSGNNDTDAGYVSQWGMSTGSFNTSMGGNTMYGGNGSGNTSLGYEAIFGDNGNHNTAAGAQSMAVNGASGSNNACFGIFAGYALTSGGSNTLIGYIPGYSLTTGSNNTLIGYTPGGFSATSASSNIGIGYLPNLATVSSSQTVDLSTHTSMPGSKDVAIGYYVLGATTTDGNGNVGIGSSSLQSVTTGTSSVAIGSSALLSVTTGSSNVAMGKAAMLGISATPLTGSYNTTVGDYALNTIQGAAALNTAMGYQALFSATSASNNTALGINALYSNTTGTPNTAAGGNALYFNTTGADNVAIGSSAMLGITGTKLTGSFNTAVGDDALFTIQGAAANNTAVGYQALNSATSTSSNSALGYQAGYAGTAITTGANDTFIGYQAQSNGAAYTNGTALGNGAILTCSNCITLGNGSITNIYGQVTSITAISDRRLKKDIQDLDLGLDFIGKLHPVSYRFNNGDETLRYGFIAQELEQALPAPLQNMAETTEPEHGVALLQRQNDEMRTYRVTYGELFAPMVKTIQELKVGNDRLRSANKNKAAEIKALRARFNKLKSMALR